MTISAFTCHLPVSNKHLRNRGATVTRRCPMTASAVQYGRIQHAGVLVKDTATSKQFYMDVFGMQDDDELRNPKLPFKGSFLKAGSSQIHLMQLPNPDPLDGRPEHGGRYVSGFRFVQPLATCSENDSTIWHVN